MKPSYCHEPSVTNCRMCSLSNYGRDCQNNPIVFEIKQVITPSNLKIDNAEPQGGSFDTDAGRYDGQWYESAATDKSGKHYRVIWTTVDWDAQPEYAADWTNPDYILDYCGHLVTINRVCQNIRAARELAGISQKALADRMGVGQARIAEWEMGLKDPTSSTLFRIASALEIEPGDLLK